MTGYGQFGSPGCCCLEGCTIYGDLFATDTIGSNWTEVAGDWAIAAGILSTDEADALVIASLEHPDGDGLAQVVTVDVRLAAADDRARVVIAYDDSDNYLFAEIWISSDGCGHVQAYERIAGTNTPLGDEYPIPFNLPLDTWHTVTLCFLPGESVEDPGTLGLQVESGASSWSKSVETSPDLPGNQAGVGTGATVTDDVDFDNFDYQFHYDEETHSNCPDCEETVPACVLHSDDFTREALGCTWEEVAGDWSIDDDQLTIDEEDAILRNRTPHPTNDAHGQIEFTFRAEAGVVILAILDYTDDENFFFVKLEPGSHGDCGRVSFWRRTADVDAQLGIDSLLLGMTADDEETHLVTICWQGEVVRVILTPDTATDYSQSSHSVNGIEQESAEPYVGLGTGAGGGSSQVWFDDFSLTRLFVEGLDSPGSGCVECTFQNCVLYFNNPREDAAEFPTTFNCLWTIAAGTWTVNSLTSSNAETLFALATGGGTAFNELIEVSTSNALLINETGHPLTTGEGYLDMTSAAEVQVVTLNYGDIVRLLIGVEDDDNYLYAEFEWAADDESTGFLRVGKVVAGVDTELDETATSVVAGQPHEDHDGSVTDQLPSILRVCYDGYEIRAGWINNAEAAITNYNFTSAVATAGTGWNPGKSGLATLTIADWVDFGGFRFYHDIYGGDPNCAPCGNGALCTICRAADESDLTPPVMLVQFQNLAPDTVDGCADAEQFNDTFALPFFQQYTATGATCRWQIYPLLCDPVVGTPPNITVIYVELEALTGMSIGSGTFAVRAVIDAYNPAESTPSYDRTTNAWVPTSFWFTAASLPDYVDEIGFDCLEFFDDWIDLETVLPNWMHPFTSGGSNWMIPGGAAFDISTARVKVLA